MKLRRTSLAVPMMFIFLAQAPLAKDPNLPAPPEQIAKPANQSALAFEDITTAAGLNFVHWNGMSGHFFLPEIVGGGGAMLDYDGDGDLDLYLVQGAIYPSGGPETVPLHPYPGKVLPRDSLWRNDLTVTAEGKRSLHLVDVTERAGISSTGFGMGVAAADVNNDGHIDLYVTNLGPNQLWINKGDGTFKDDTENSGVGDTGWSTSATFFDFDRDGWLDLYVANYVVFSAKSSPKCYAANSALDYCGPDAYPAARDRLYRNKGNGIFEDVSTQLARYNTFGAGLGTIAADLNGDGWLDLYVANDGDPNHLWINSRNGSFSDEGLFAGVAVNGGGTPEAGMGITAGDYDRDGDEDLFLTHLDGETNTLYQNGGNSFFDDLTNERQLALPSLSMTGFGTGWFDLDNDGWLDLLIVNGAVRTLLDQAARGDAFPLKQRNQLFLNQAGKAFADVSKRGGQAFSEPAVGRGAAFGDMDNDGATDVLLMFNNGPARLLINRAGGGQHWLGIRLTDGSKRDLLGSWVKLIAPPESPQWRRVRSDGGYVSSHDPRVLFGLGSNAKVQAIEVVWPDGLKQSFTIDKVDRYITISPSPVNEAHSAAPQPGGQQKIKDTP